MVFFVLHAFSTASGSPASSSSHGLQFALVSKNKNNIVPLSESSYEEPEEPEEPKEPQEPQASCVDGEDEIELLEKAKNIPGVVQLVDQPHTCLMLEPLKEKARVLRDANASRISQFQGKKNRKQIYRKNRKLRSVQLSRDENAENSSDENAEKSSDLSTCAAALMLMHDVLETLKGLHRIDIVHADLSLDNIQVPANEEGPFFKLVNFGKAFLDSKGFFNKLVNFGKAFFGHSDSKGDGAFSGTSVPRWRGSDPDPFHTRNRMSDDVEVLLQITALMIWPNIDFFELQRAWLSSLDMARENETRWTNFSTSINSNWCDKIPTESKCGFAFSPICQYFMSEFYAEDGTYKSRTKLIKVEDSMLNLVQRGFETVNQYVVMVEGQVKNLKKYTFAEKKKVWEKAIDKRQL